jgi:signal transduction histidine kinase
MRSLRSLTTRLVLSHMLVATLSGMTVALFAVIVVTLFSGGESAEEERRRTVFGAVPWLLGAPDGGPNDPADPWAAGGYTLVVAPSDTVVFSRGETPCRAGAPLATCAPDLAAQAPGERFFERGGRRWVQVVLPIATGHRLIALREPWNIADPSLEFPGLTVRGVVPFALTLMAAMGLLSAPVAFLLAWVSARPLANRLGAIAAASRRFAAGDLGARVHDRRHDEVGALARQFDDMAGALEQNVGALRDLAQRNAELARRAEEAATLAERVRLSRDLHDAIAQRLFSLSVSAATLPDLIERDHRRGIEQARSVATLAEETLLDLRTLLVELRPSGLIQRGLPEAIEALCDEWQAAQGIPVACSLVLSGAHLPAPVEDVLYRVTQEALSNVARHAGATTVHVSLVEGRRQITLSVTDDGRGFAPVPAGGDGSFGLIGMRERARAVGGSLVIESDTQRGTTLRLTLPLVTEDQP